MRKKLVVILLVLFAALAVLYVVWRQSPEEKNREVVAEAHKAAEERLQEKLSQAEDPEKNGFINPTFVPYWGRIGIEQKETSPAGDAILAWRNYSTTPASQPIDHKALREQADEGYLTALAGMEEIAPELREAMNKPLFIAPNFELHAESVVPNLISVRACAQAMVGLAESEITQGQTEQAALDLVSVVNFGSGLNGQGVLILDMVGLAVQHIGLDGFNGLIDINSDLSAETWKRLNQSLLGSIAPPETLLHSLQGEMLFIHNSVAIFSGRPDSAEEALSQAPLAVLPGYFDREERIYNNVMSDLIVQYQNQGTLDLPKEFLEPSTLDEWSGRSGLLAVLMMPNVGSAARRIDTVRRVHAVTATAVGIAAYRAQEGKLPKTIAQLSEAGIPVTKETDWLQAMEYKVEGDTATLKARVQEANGEPTIVNIEEWSHPWLDTDGEFFTYRFGPVQPSAREAAAKVAKK